MRNTSNFTRIRIDKTSLFIASIAPLLWVVDSFRGAALLHDSFVKELFFPDQSALSLRLLLVFFILVQAWFFNLYSRNKNRVFEAEGKLRSLFDLAQDALVVIDIEGRVVEASNKALELWGYPLQELAKLDLTKLCAANESERLLKFVREIIENKESGVENVMLAVKDSVMIPADIEGRFIDNLETQGMPGIFLNIARHRDLKQPAPAVAVEPEIPATKPAPKIIPTKPEPQTPPADMLLEFSRKEETIRQEEAKKAQEALKNLEQKYLELMRVRLSEECKKVEDAVRLEEKKKTEEQIRALESQSSRGLEEKIKQERGRIEETVRQEEGRKVQEQMSALENKYSDILKSRVTEARQQAEELVSRELKTKYEEQFRQSEAKFASESGSKISEGRKLIEDSVRREEQHKAEENSLALRQKYEELLRKGIEDERRRNEEAVKLERAKIEAASRDQEKQKVLEAINELKLKHEEILRKAIEDERRRSEEAEKSARGLIEKAVRQEEDAKAEDRVKALEIKYRDEMEEKLGNERILIEKAVKQEEEKKAQAAIKALEVQLQARSKEIKAPEIKVPEISRLVSGVGQQMLNPLSAILNYLKVVKIKLTQGSDLKPQEFKDTINLIEENALLCKNILNSLSDPSRVSKASFQPVSINDVVAKIDAILGQDLRLQNITVSKSLQTTLANISGDPLLLTQVVFNLVSNAKWAIKSNSYGGSGTLTIKTQSSPDKSLVELWISDNGVGIPEKDLPRIFEPFFTTKPDGLGLGLTIAQGIIKEHKGQIQVESKEGVGSTFKLIFPALN